MTSAAFRILGTQLSLNEPLKIMKVLLFLSLGDGRRFLLRSDQKEENFLD